MEKFNIYRLRPTDVEDRDALNESLKEIFGWESRWKNRQTPEEEKVN